MKLVLICSIVAVLTFGIVKFSSAVDNAMVVRGEDNCKTSLFGKQSKVKFTASSVFRDLEDFQPEKARIWYFWKTSSNTEDQGHAWCPNKLIKTETEEWIEVEFEALKLIKLIFMMGRGEGNYKEYVPFFLLRYQRVEGGPWYDYHDIERNKILTGNVDPRNIHRVLLNPMIVAKKVRIYPYQEKVGRQMCLRLALYGCNFQDGVVEYQAPVGSSIQLPGYNTPLLLADTTYDGKLKGGRLVAGMGQLMDNVAYLQSPDRDQEVPGKPGYNFIGWKRKRGDTGITLLFIFDHVRNFSLVRLHIYNSVAQGITVFSQARAEFSVGGKIFDQKKPPVVFKYSRDRRLQNSRWVVIDLENRTARYIRLTLTFDMDWLLLTEVQFNSSQVTVPIPIEQYNPVLPISPTTSSLAKDVGGYPNVFDQKNSGNDLSGDRSGIDPESNGLNGDSSSKNDGGSGSGGGPQYDYIFAIVATLSLLLCLLVILGWWCRRRSLRQKKMKGKMMGGNNGGGGVGGAGGALVVQCNGLPGGMGGQMGGEGACLSERYMSPLNHILGMNGSSVHQPLLKDTSLYTNVATDEDDEVCLMGLVTGGVGGRQMESCPVSSSGNVILPYAAYSVQQHSRLSPVPFLGTEYASTTLFSNSPPSCHPGLQLQLQPHHPGLSYHSPVGATMNPMLPPPRSNGTGVGGGVPLQIIANPMANMIDPSTNQQRSNSGCYATNPMLPAMPSGLTVQIPPPPPFMQIPHVRQVADLNIQGLTGTTVYAWPPGTASTMSSSATTTGCSPGGGGTIDRGSSSPLPALPEISLSRLRLVERLGGGQYGEVHLAEVVDQDGLLPGDSPNCTPTVGCEDETLGGGGAVTVRPRIVAVKMLRKDSSDQAKREFQQEISMLARLCDPNLAGVLGVCTEQATLCAIVEYTRHGDLHQFLRSRRPAPAPTAGSSASASPGGVGACAGAEVMRTSGIDIETSDTLSYGCLIYLAAQVASGMKYLEAHGLVHRDLACRNCLVGPRFSVKISDLGMCRRINATDYCRVDGRPPLPIRWMAWETLLHGKFSCKSDVWSFAVTLWEVLTFCRQQPLDHLTNEQVVDNASRVGLEDPSAEYPSCPHLCPKEIYDLMVECWQKREAQRPSFREIHMFLQRKNLGFDADEEYQVSRASGGSSSTTGAAAGPATTFGAGNNMLM